MKRKRSFLAKKPSTMGEAAAEETLEQLLGLSCDRLAERDANDTKERDKAKAEKRRKRALTKARKEGQA